MRLLALVVLAGSAACGTLPEPQRQLRADIAAAVGRSDEGSGARRYLDWRSAGGVEDRAALDALAVGTLENALRAAAAPARLAAIRAAERFDEPTLFEPVTRLLGDDDEVVRAAAAAAVVRGHPDAGRVLAQSLRSPDAEARALAVAAVGKKVGAPAHADLRRALDDPDERVREAAVVALRPLATAEDSARIDALATSDPSGSVRARALATLGSSGVEIATAGLEDSFLGARIAAVDAVARLLGDRADRLLAPLAAGPPSGEGSGEGDPIVAIHAASRLGRPADAIARAARSSDWTVRAAAANAVRDARDAGALDALAGNAAGSVDAQGGNAARGAGPLDALAGDPTPAVALAAARALARVGRADRASAVFAAHLAGATPAAEVEAAEGLAALGDRRGVEALEKLATHPEPAIRRAALAGLPRGLPVPAAIVAALGDEDREVRVAAAVAILVRVR